jgi:site-specific DNA-cytosine methylase
MQRNGSATSSAPDTSRQATLTSEASLTCARRSPRLHPSHFFAGIGGWSIALRLAGWPDDRPVWTGSCPCQPFSAAGAGKAADDERHLWPAWFPLIAECRPAVVFGEQVEAAVGWGWLDAVFADLEGEGYACGATVLPACGLGAPHIRQRLWFVGHTDGAGLETQWSVGVGAARNPNNFRIQAHLAPWPTPMAGTPAQKGYNEAGNTDSGRKTVTLSAWPTPNVADDNNSRWKDAPASSRRRLEKSSYSNLAITAQALSSWATPTASDHKGAPSESAQYRKDGKFRNDMLDFQVAFSTASGETPSGSSAPTENGGQLDPDHSRWVMGYSAAHLNCAPTETPSFLKSQRNSSKQQTPQSERRR